MASIPAQEVAKEVIAKVRRGEKPNLQEIQQKHGYSKNSAKSMKVKETKTYRDAMLPIVSAMEKERDRLIKAISEKDLSKEKYRDMTDGLDKLTKNIQLLNGGKTSNEGVQISWE